MGDRPSKLTGKASDIDLVIVAFGTANWLTELKQQPNYVPYEQFLKQLENDTFDRDNSVVHYASGAIDFFNKDPIQALTAFKEKWGRKLGVVPQVTFQVYEGGVTKPWERFLPLRPGGWPAVEN